MKIHEYQAKDLFSDYGIPVPPGRVAETAEQATVAAEKMGVPVVIKAQIHAGGRGKGGGIKVAKSLKEATQYASEILGATLVTAQTGPEGRVVKKVLVENTVDIERELYASVVLDRRHKCLAILVSGEGGMDIEAVAKEAPEKLAQELVSPFFGPRQYQLRNLCQFLQLSGGAAKKVSSVLHSMVKLFREKDATLVEVNPLVVAKNGDVVALDAKITFEESALYRHPEIAELRDLNEENPLDVEASKYDINYIKLAGNIGCMVNGAGLAMATMDLIKLVGGEPANFLDVGGGADAEQIEQAFRLILSDPNTEGIFINIFGGILRCDTLAQGLVEGARKANVKAPVVIHLEGTNAEEGRKILSSSALPFATADTMDDGARKIIKNIRSSGRKAL